MASTQLSIHFNTFNIFLLLSCILLFSFEFSQIHFKQILTLYDNNNNFNFIDSILLNRSKNLDVFSSIDTVDPPVYWCNDEGDGGEADGCGGPLADRQRPPGGPAQQVQ